MSDSKGRLFAKPLCVASLVGVAIAVSGCSAVGPDYRPPASDASSAFANAEQPGVSAKSVDARWWEAFRDSTLTALVGQAFQANPDLQSAAANLRAARAAWRESQFDLFPTVTAGGSDRTQQRSRGIFGGGLRDNDEFNLINIGFDATWELDFFGRVRRGVEASRADYEALEATRRDAVVSVAAELARNYFDLRGTQQQLAVARRNAENQAATLKYTVARLNGGQGTALDTARAEEQLQSTLAGIPLLEARIRRDMHRIAVLCGQPPESFYRRLEPAEPIAAAPAIIAIGDPRALLQRRPDVRAAERSLAATTARIGVVTADLFPRVTFSGNVAFEARSLSGLAGAGGETYNFGPSIRWAAFDIGRVLARIRGADARAEAQLAAYQKTVLLALEETENALTDYRRIRERRESFRAAAAASEKAAHLARLRYQDGVADFLAVLDAERRVLEAQDRLAQTETDTATALVAVYKALGGGWEWTLEPPTAAKKPVSAGLPLATETQTGVHP